MQPNWSTWLMLHRIGASWCNCYILIHFGTICAFLYNCCIFVQLVHFCTIGECWRSCTLSMRSSAPAAFVSQCSCFASECNPSYCYLQPWDQKPLILEKWRKNSRSVPIHSSSSAVLGPTSNTFLIQYGFLTKALTKDIEILLKFYPTFTTFWTKVLIKFERVCIQ